MFILMRAFQNNKHGSKHIIHIFEMKQLTGLSKLMGTQNNLAIEIDEIVSRYNRKIIDNRMDYYDKKLINMM